MPDLFKDMYKPNPMDEMLLHRLISEREATKREQQKFFSDPANVEKLLSHNMRQAVPEEKLKKLPIGSPLAKIEAAIPEGDPRKDIGSSVLEEVMQNIPRLPSNVHPASYIAESLKNRFASKSEDIYKYIQKEESALPLFGKKVASAPGYEEWKKGFLEQTKPEGITPESLATSAGMGAGLQLAGRGLLKAGFTKLAPWLLAGATTGPISLGVAAAATAFTVADILSSLVSQTEWARQRPIQALGANLVGTYGAFKGVGKLAGKAEAVVNSLKEELGGYEESLNILKQDPSAKNIISLYDKSIAKDRATSGAVDLADQAARGELKGKTSDLFAELGTTHALEPFDAASLYVRDRQKQGVNLSRTLLQRIGSLSKVEDTEKVKMLVQNGMPLEYAAIKVLSEETALKTYYPEFATSLGMTEGIPAVSKYAMERGISPAATLKQMRTTAEGLASREQMPVFKNVEFTAPTESANISSIFDQIPGLSREDFAAGIGGAEKFAATQAKVAATRAKTAASKIDLSGKPVVVEKAPTDEELADKLFKALSNPDAKIAAAAQKKFGEVYDNIPESVLAALSKKKSAAFDAMNPVEQSNTIEKAANTVTTQLDKVLGLNRADLAARRKKIVGTAGLVIAAITGGLGLDIDSDSQLSFVGTAEAGTFDRIVGAAVKGAKALSTEELYKAQKDAHLIARVATKNDFALTDDMIKKSISVDTSNVSLEYTKKLSFGMDRGLSPSVPGLIHYGIQKGKEVFADPVRELADRFGATVPTNIANESTVFNNYMNDSGVKTAWKGVAEATKPMVERYYNSIYNAGYAKDRIGFYSDLIKKVTKESRKHLSDEEETAVLGKLYEYEGELKKFQEILGGRSKEIQDLTAEYEPIARDLAQKYSGSRVFYAADDTADFKKYPWLKGMLSREELVAAARLKKHMEFDALRLIDVGEKPILKDPYIHYTAHPDINYKLLEESLSKISDDGAAALRLAGMHSRSVGALPMMPDVHYAMNRYIPDFNRRIEGIEFWNGQYDPKTGKFGENTGWKSHMMSPQVQNNDGLRTFWDAVNRSFDPTERTTMNKWAQRMYDFEIGRNLALSPSVGFKHLIKMLANWAIFGAAHTLETLPKSIYRWGKSFLTQRGLGEQLEDEAIRSYTSQNRMMQIVSDLDITRVPENGWDKFMQLFNQKGSMIINAIERLDRGHSVVAAMSMAAKQGMTPAQAAYGVMDTVLKTNFLSGPLNPAWLRDPKVRMLFMFQGTPFKIMEQRALNAMRAGGNIAAATKELWSQLQNIRSDIKDGEHIFKWNLIKDALTRDKDIFGTSSTKQFMRTLILIGTGISAGRQFFDADLLAHMVHPPFLKLEEKQIGLNINPAMTAAYQSWNAKESDDKDLWIAEFFKQWLREGPIQQNFIKAARISRDDIPARYNDSRLKYIFGVPAIKEE